jgi:hypothetical protein
VTLQGLPGFSETLLCRGGVGGQPGTLYHPCIHRMSWRLTQQTMQTQHPQVGPTTSNTDPNPTASSCVRGVGLSQSATAGRYRW